jgi:hypothetical protein
MTRNIRGNTNVKIPRPRLRLVHIVRGQEHRLAEVAERADRRPGVPAGAGVKARGGLVEEDQVRIADQRQRQVQAPELAARQVPRANITLLAELDQLEELVDGSPARVVAAVHLERLGDGQVVLHAALLQDDPDALAQLTLPVRRVHPSTCASPAPRVR